MDLRRLFERYTGALREHKLAYMLYNLLNAKSLRANETHYRKLGIRKRYWQPLTSADITQPDLNLPWLDRPEIYTQLGTQAAYHTANPADRALMEQWVQDGFVVLRGFFGPEPLQAANQALDELLAQGQAGFNYTGVKVMDAHTRSPALKSMVTHPELHRVLNLLLGRPMQLFQSISFIEGSQQALHSDFIHMTTEPRGYLAAAWIALEDVQADAGPLEYIPGSHRLPYVLGPDYDGGNTRWRIGADNYKRYERKIAQIVAEQGLKTITYLPQAGDVLLWHANLLHGGQAITRKGSTRRSLVAHYFAQGVLCWHEITERPAVFAR
jgi:hypothetical protein